MTYRIISVSPKKSFQETLLAKSLTRLCIDTSNVIFFGDNKESINIAYNKGINQCKAEGVNIAILVHDDVFINSSDFEYRIRKYATKYDVFALAGNTTVNFKEPALWHLMSDRKNLRGCVAHGDSERYSYTSFGPVHERVVIFDGVFIGINLKKLPDSVRFDENIPSRFHFYDIVFSLECSLAKLNVGIADIPIVHASPGLREMNAEWRSGQAYFLSKYERFKNKTLTV